MNRKLEPRTVFHLIEKGEFFCVYLTLDKSASICDLYLMHGTIFHCMFAGLETKKLSRTECNGIYIFTVQVDDIQIKP